LSHLTKDVFGLFSRLAQRHRLHIIGGSHPVPLGVSGQSVLQNVCPVALPNGRVLMQPKLHITPSETEAWGLRGGAHLAVIPTPKAKIGVLICYDSEFPEAARHLADQGVDILFVPYCTDDRQGHLRVQLCCRARAIENQIYVAAAGLVGNLPGVAGLDVHYGRAAVFTPSDFTFARDGIQAEADPNVETLLVTDVDLGNLYRARERGSVRPRLDRRPDLFELKANFVSSDLPEYPLTEPSDGV
jgi:predicted amidohydrolase